MRALAERAYFLLCLALGRLLRGARYSKTRIVYENGEPRVRKRRLFYAPLLVWLGDPLVRLLDTGVRILPQRDWEAREREVYSRLYGASIRVDADGALVLPRFTGETLATLLQDPEMEPSVRQKAIELAVVALANFHARGFTHGDAMAENVLVDLEAGVARWFDFETLHESTRSMARRRADDLRALLSTCLLRTPSGTSAEIVRLIVDAYGDAEVARVVASSFASVLERPLAFHLGQSPLSAGRFRETARLLSQRIGTDP